MKRVVDARQARDPEYRKIIEEIAQKKKCPFCPENFVYHDKPVLRRVGSWFLTRNFRPYPNTRYHFLIIGLKHKQKLAQLTPGDFAEIGSLLQWAEQTYKLQGGAVAMRFGKTQYTGATVVHMHCHLIVPKLEVHTIDGTRQRVARVVSFPIG